jgi:hypothetical protein
LPLKAQPDKLSLVKSESEADDRPTENPGVGGSIPPLSTLLASSCVELMELRFVRSIFVPTQSPISGGLADLRK